MKLTNEHRGNIARIAAEEKFDALISAKEGEIAEFATQLYQSIYQREVLAIMGKLPDVAFNQTKEIIVRNGKRERIRLYMSQTRKVFARDTYGIELSDEDSVIWSASAETLTNALKDLKSRKCTLKNELSRMMAVITTDKKLLEIWPESEPYLKKALGIKPVVNPPAVIVGAFKSLVETA